MELAAWIFALLGAVYWLVALTAGARTTRALRSVLDAELDAGATLPSVSIVVAARDEAESMRHEAETIAAFDHPSLEVVLVDDRSSDGTGQLMDAVAAADDRVHVVHVDQLPAGWLGKVHALEQGRLVAAGEWLLFTDADVELEPDAPRRAVAFAERHRLDSLALLPEVESDGVLVAGVVAVFSRWLTIAARLWKATDPERPESFGVGACNLVRRSALERAGGLEWLRMDIADDAALAQLIARGGGRTMLASGVGLVRVRWQDSVRGMTRGFEKYGGSGGLGSIPGAIAASTVAALGEIAPWLALVTGLLARATTPILLAATLIVVPAALLLAIARTVGAPRRGILAGPVAPLLVWWMQVRAALLELRRGGVVWRGTFYATEAIRAGKRYRVPGFGS